MTGEKGIIYPIPKDTDARDLGKYRGLTLTSSESKYKSVIITSTALWYVVCRSRIRKTSLFVSSYVFQNYFASLVKVCCNEE